MSNGNDFVIENGVLKRYAGPGGDVVIPEGVTEILYGVFSGYGNVNSITLPDNLRKIGYAAFQGCSNLQQIIMPVDTLRGCTTWTDAFGGTGKTIEVVILRKGEEPLCAIGSFRKAYWSQQWNYRDDYLVPVTTTDLPHYDRLVATGDYEGFKMNEQGRLKAMLWRLLEKDRPVAEEYRVMFGEFLAGKFSKVIKMAEEDGKASYIRAAIEAGAITDANKKKITNALKKSAIPEIQQLADQLDDILTSVNIGELAAETVSNAEKKYLDQLKKINAKAILLKAGVEQVPDVLMATKTETAPAEYMQLILAEYIAQYKNRSYVFAPLADEVAAQLDKNSLVDAILLLYRNARPEKVQLSFLPVVFRFADGATAGKIYRSYKGLQWMEATINNCLMLSDTREAMLLADKYQLLQEYAQMRNTTAGYLQDTMLYDFGFDENGVKIYDLGGRTVRVSLNNDLSLSLTDIEKGKTVKSIPKKDVDPERYNAANADFAETKKSVKKAAKNKSDRLFREFLEATEMAADKWQTTYISNPLLRQIANLLVWEQSGQTFVLSGKNPIMVDGQPYPLSTEAIRLAHPMDMDWEIVTAWQKYFTAHGLKQPFEQIWEPVTTATAVHKERYKGCMIPYYRFTGQEKRGISVDRYHDSIHIIMKDCMTHIDRIDWRRYDLNINDRFEIVSFEYRDYTRRVNHIVAYLDRITVYDRVRNDDLTVVSYLERFTLAQIVEFIKVAAESNSSNVMAILLDYKEKHFADFDPMAEFTLD